MKITIYQQKKSTRKNRQGSAKETNMKIDKKLTTGIDKNDMTKSNGDKGQYRAELTGTVIRYASSSKTDFKIKPELQIHKTLKKSVKQSFLFCDIINNLKTNPVAKVGLARRLLWGESVTG